MPPYMAPQPIATPNSPGGRLLQMFIQHNQQQKERDNALAESGRDPFAERLQGMIPINRATDVANQQGRLAGIAELMRGAQISRGGFGDNPIEPLLAKIKTMARGMNAGKADDLMQAGAETVARRMQNTSIGGPDAVRMARTGMRNELAKGGTGVRSEVSRAIDDAVTNSPNRGELSLWSEVRKKFPNMSLEEFRNARGNIRQPMLSLDAASEGAEGSAPSLLDRLRSTDNPEEAAALKEKLGTLTPQQQINLQKHLGGEPVNRAIIDRILKKMGIRGDATPISGGSVGPEDANAAFPASDFRLELGKQPRQMFGQEGPNVDPRLSRFSQDYNPQLMASTVWPDQGFPGHPGAVTEEGFHTLGAGRVAEDWDKLREVFGNLGKLQGNN